MIHWGLLGGSLGLGAALLAGLFGLWEMKGTVMWGTRVLFVGFFYGSVLSVLIRRRDASPLHGGRPDYSGASGQRAG